MPQSDSTPRLSKWPFLVGDAALLGAAWLIAANARHPLSGTAIVSIVVCGVAAAVAGAIPFLADYGRRTDEALDERQKALEALSRSSAAAAEQIGIAATGYQQIAELAQANLQQAEQVQQHLQNTSAEFLSRLATMRVDEKRKLEKDFSALRSSEVARLETVLDKMARAVEDFGRIQAAPWTPAPVSAEPPSPPPAPAPEPVAPPAEAPAPETPVPESQTVAVAGAEVERGGPTALSASAALKPTPEETVPPTEPTPAAGEGPPKPAPRKRPRKTPRPEESSAAPAPPGPDGEEALFAEVPAETNGGKTEPGLAAPSEFSQLAPDEGLPANSLSADGATRLIVTAYIGIGNRLFIRGEGPGLSWERGTPLQFVSIGKWRWESSDASAPVRFKLYKNDEIECATLPAQSIEPGRQQEVAASF